MSENQYDLLVRDTAGVERLGGCWEQVLAVCTGQMVAV